MYSKRKKQRETFLITYSNHPLFREKIVIAAGGLKTFSSLIVVVVETLNCGSIFWQLSKFDDDDDTVCNTYFGIYTFL